ncbi:MAG: ATP-binding protein [Nanoarchaeota archaeon]|nr:ATP-binding protein [Nanoarchaeota archaeon]MBU4300650.1 ATP-binding protein [Nanoarchaeota archaeon]MBU4452488.1 ATP-binding protein [Nanoarchaeota archaeon]MCG2723435.1 ATP-binding protein [archaeon]
MIRDILLLQKRELENKLKEPYAERDYDSNKLNSPLIKVIIGPRRAGKSFFALHFLNKQGNFGYVNFDDEKLSETQNYDEIVSALNSIYYNPKYILFDEIQNLPKWELFANRLARQGYNLIITGSNAKLLSAELATHLTGRHSLIHIFPFSFKEFLHFEKKELTTSETKEMLLKYITYGGYPEPLMKHLDFKEYLSTLFDSVLYKDIIKRHKIRFAEGIENLALYLISNIANEQSYNSLSKITKCKSPYTVEKYLGYLEEAFLVFAIPRFSFKVKEQISSNKKIYCTDNGIIHAKAFKFSPNIGKLYENIVACKLKKAELNHEIRAYYWKNAQQEEVDFVVKKELAVTQLIQVCYDISNPETKKREIRALLKAGEELKCHKLLILTEDYDAEEDSEWFNMKGKIKFIPLWKWLLQDS